MTMTLLRRLLAGLLPVPLLLVTAACTDMLYSDSQNSARRSAQARESAIASMKTSSSQAVAAQPVTGQALEQLLSGNTHVKAYRKRSGDAKPYLTQYDYYAPDGTFIGRDTHGRRTAEYQDKGQWKVAGETLCITKRGDQNCYTIRLAPDGTIQYWIHKPGDPFHGLLTRNIDEVRAGLQEPEYVSDPAAMR